MRLFFALWPDEETRDRLAAVGDLLPKGRGRRVPREKLHLTLAFLGSVSADTRDALQSGMESVRAGGFSLLFDHAGWFKRSRVVWLAPTDIPDALPVLIGHINSVVIDCGLKPDDRPYRPHLTLARKAGKPPGRLDFEPIRWQISDFCLVESVTHASGAEYRVLQRRPLSPD